MLWLNLLIIIMAVVAAVIQILGARLEHRPCRAVKHAYALSLSIAALFVFFMEVIKVCEYGYVMALLVLVFQVLVGGIVRLIHLNRKPKEYLDCEH